MGDHSQALCLDTAKRGCSRVLDLTDCANLQMVAMSSSGDDHPNLQTLKSFLATEILVQDRDLPGSRKELIAEMRTVRQQISKISAVISDISGKNRSTPLLNRRKKKAQALLSHRPSSAADGQQSYRMPPSVRDNLLRPQSVGPPSIRPTPVIQSTRSAGFSEVRSSARGQAAVAFGAFGAGADQDGGVPDVRPLTNVKSCRNETQISLCSQWKIQNKYRLILKTTFTAVL